MTRNTDQFKLVDPCDACDGTGFVDQGHHGLSENQCSKCDGEGFYYYSKDSGVLTSEELKEYAYDESITPVVEAPVDENIPL